MLILGEYIRTEDGLIGRFIHYFRDTQVYQIEISEDFARNIKLSDIKNHNENINYLIEVGDFVNDKKVIEIRRENGKTYLMTNYVPIDYIKQPIKSIVTKELFETNKFVIRKEVNNE